MTTEVQVESSTEVSTGSDDQTVTTTTTVTSLEDALKRIAELEAETAEKAELVKKVRKYEKSTREKAEEALKEQGKYKELYEAELNRRNEIETQFTNKLIDAQLTEALSKMGVEAVSTAMKLIDKKQIDVKDGVVDASTVNAAIEQLKKSDAFLFKPVVTAPVLERAGEGTVTKNMSSVDKIAAALNKLNK